MLNWEYSLSKLKAQSLKPKTNLVIGKFQK